MVRKSVLLLTGIGMLFILIPSVAADGYWYPMVLNSTLNAPLISLQYYHKVVTTQNSREKFELNWTSGLIAINYYIFTEANFNNWSLGLPSTTHASVENTSGAFDMFIANGVNQTWIFVWYNPSLTSTHLLGTYERYKWVEVDGFIPGFPFEAILIGAISALTLGLILKRKIHKK
ncbi:MAG: hypothetical protein ACFFCH_06265 [Promethearchaeota archaeon]